MSPPRLCVNVNAVNATITSSQKLEAETLVPAVIPGTALFYLKIYFMDAETASKCSGSPSPQNCERPALQEEEIIRWIAATSERMLRSSMTDVAEDEALLSRVCLFPPFFSRLSVLLNNMLCSCPTLPAIQVVKK